MHTGCQRGIDIGVSVSGGGTKLLARRTRTRGMVTLYALDGCPYCETVHDALADHGIDYETVWTDPLHSDRNEIKRISGQRGVPVIVDESRGVTMAESENILTFIERSLA
jgi:glutaredoxin